MQQATRTGEIGPVAAHSHIMVIIYKWSNIAKTSIMLVGNPHRSPGSKMSRVPLSFCVPSGSVSPAALRLAHYFRIALFLGPIDYIMLCKLITKSHAM